MNKYSNLTSFGTLFKKYRLRSEIETLAEFGDLLAEEGIVYETSLFTRWQRGERVPKDRKVLLKVLNVFVKREGIQSIEEINLFLEAADNGYLTQTEKGEFSILRLESKNEVLQASLGGLLKDYRIQKNISLKELSNLLSWKNENKLLDIEQGSERPSRELIDLIGNRLNLKKQEINYLLYVGNYLPTEEEIQQARNHCESVFLDWPYPAVLIDFSWRVLFINSEQARIHGIIENKMQSVNRNYKRIIEIVFEPSYNANVNLKGKEFQEWKDWLVELIIHFRLSQQNRVKEIWYKNLINNMMDNKLFREAWRKSYEVKNFKVAKHGKKIIINPQDKSKRLQFYFSVVPFLYDPRFEIEFCTPVDSQTAYFLGQ